MRWPSYATIAISIWWGGKIGVGQDIQIVYTILISRGERGFLTWFCDTNELIQDVISGMLPWTSYRIRKIASCAYAGNVFPRPPRVSDPNMHHGTCVALTNGFLWGREKHSRHSRRMRNPQFYVSDKRSMWGNLSEVGVLRQRKFLCSVIVLIFSALSKPTLAIRYHVYIW